VSAERDVPADAASVARAAGAATASRAWYARPAAGLGIAVLLALAVNAGVLRNEFAMDDAGILKRDPTIRSLANIPQLFQSDYWMPEMVSGLYRPLVKTSFALNHAFGNLDPRGFHLVNLLLHALVTGLSWSFFRRVSGSVWIAGAGAALFAVHAVHTEVTSNVSFGRPELLSATFFLLATLFYIGPAGERVRSTRRSYAASLVCYALALLSKESAITLVGVLALFDLAFRSDASRSLGARLLGVLRANGLRYAGFVAVTAGYLLIRTAALEGGRALPPEMAIDNPLFGLPVGWRLLNALWVSLHYGRLLVAPLHLAYDYSYEQIPTFQIFTDPRLWVALAAWILLAVGWIAALRRSPIVFFALGFLLATFSIVSNLVLPIGTILGERLLYLPSIGFCLLVAAGVWQLATAIPRRRVAVFTSVIAVLVALHAARSIERIPNWRTQWTLYMHDVARSPNSTKAHSNAGAAFTHFRRYDEALEHLRRSIEIQPYGYPVPWSTAGMVLTTIGRDEEAREMYEGAVRNGTEEPAVFNNLGFQLVDRGLDVPRGLELLERAVEKWPDDPEVLDSLGWAYYKVGRHREAHEKLKRAVQMPGTPEELEARREHLRVVEQALGGDAPTGG
jgi:tetratricopeptide (TPR) repeat protein